MSEWIKCSDRLPNGNQDVLLSDGQWFSVGYVSLRRSPPSESDWSPSNVEPTYEGTGWVRFDFKPTHWMPLPAPPAD